MSFLLFDRKVEIRIGVPANPQATIFGIGRSWTDLKIEWSLPYPSLHRKRVQERCHG
jgi:hypothetical protein